MRHYVIKSNSKEGNIEDSVEAFLPTTAAIWFLEKHYPGYELHLMCIHKQPSIYRGEAYGKGHGIVVWVSESKDSVETMQLQRMLA